MWDDLDYSGGNWGTEWCGNNIGSELEQLTTGDGVSGYSGCGSCAHSGSPGAANTINCVLKGKACWWLWARLAGWNSNGCSCDMNRDGSCDMQDWLLFGEDWGRTDCPCPLN